ncbi:DUF397 domain-containing protein [Kitasatospora sp. NPDC057500]|uniref:DUF397 domain-containing protein n=1 Tax=Kitasatospora sp. NPDC057500 TaxID=3346151 RepID=UPI0036CBB14E
MNSDLVWFKSSYSGGEGGACVEVADATEFVMVRDSKDKSGPQLAFSAVAWQSFIEFAQSV